MSRSPTWRPCSVPQIRTGWRPVYHRTEGRVDGHLFITVLPTSCAVDPSPPAPSMALATLVDPADILAGQCRSPPPSAVLTPYPACAQGGPREPAQLAIIQALGSDPAREGYKHGGLSRSISRSTRLYATHPFRPL